MIIVIFGNIGVGKTTLSKGLEERLGYTLVSLTTVRKLMGKKEIYDKNNNYVFQEEKDFIPIYDSMHIIAKFLLGRGEDIILETMYKKEQREKVIQIAKEMNSRYVFIKVICNDEVIKKRLTERKKKDFQTAGLDLHYQNKENSDETEEEKYIIIDTSNKGMDECVEEVIAKIPEYQM